MGGELGRHSGLAVVATAAFLVACGEPNPRQPGARETPADAKESPGPEFGFTGALDVDCTHGGRNENGVEVFISPCARTANSPDGKWRLVNTGEPPENQAETTDAATASDNIFVEATSGRRIGPVPGLSNGMPFAMFWSPRPGWFFVDHHAGSFMQIPEVFEITSNRVVKHDAFLRAGGDAAEERFPCLPPRYDDWVHGNVMGWSRDGRRLAWVLVTRTDVCMEPGQLGSVRDDQIVYPLVMVSDIESGRVVDGSVIVLDDDKGKDFAFPDSGPYRDIVRPGETSTGGD